MPERNYPISLPEAIPAADSWFHKTIERGAIGQVYHQPDGHPQHLLQV